MAIAAGEVKSMQVAEPAHRRLQFWRSLYIQENYFVVDDALIDARRKEIEERAERISRQLDEWPLRSGEQMHLTTINARSPHMALSYSCRNNRELFQKLSALKRRLFPELTGTTAKNWGVSADPALRRESPPVRGRIRVAFIAERLNRFSSVLRDRVGVIANLPKTHFHVTAMMFNPPSGDEGSKLLTANVEQVVVLPADPSSHIPFIAAYGFDVIVFPEISLVGFTNFIPYNRLAPLQINTWGHSDTSGIDTVDLYVSSRWFETDDEDPQTHYSEELILTGGLGTHYYHAIPETSAAALDGRGSFGLPEGVNLYLLMQTLGKLHLGAVDMFRAVLTHDPTGLLVITGTECAGEQERFYTALEEFLEGGEPCGCDSCSGSRGCDAVGAAGSDAGGPAEKMAPAGRLIDRVRFLPYQVYARGAALIRCSTVMLDGYAFGGCNTTLEAIDLGTPVVTCPTQFLHGRFTQGYLRRLGLPELIADTPANCGRLAAEVAQAPLRVRRLKTAMRERKHILFHEDDALAEWNELILRRSQSFVAHRTHDDCMAGVARKFHRALRASSWGVWPDRETLRSLVLGKSFPMAHRGGDTILVTQRVYSDEEGAGLARSVAAHGWDRLEFSVIPPPATDAGALRKLFAGAGMPVVSEQGGPGQGWRLVVLCEGVPIYVAVSQSAPEGCGRAGVWTATYGSGIPHPPGASPDAVAHERQLRHYHPSFVLTERTFKVGREDPLALLVPEDAESYLETYYGKDWKTGEVPTTTSASGNVVKWSPSAAKNKVYPAAFVAGRFDAPGGELAPPARDLLLEMASLSDSLVVGIYSDQACAIGGRPCEADAAKRQKAVETLLRGITPQLPRFLFEITTRSPVNSFVDRADLSVFPGVNQAAGWQAELALFASSKDVETLSSVPDVSQRFTMHASANCVEQPWRTPEEIRKEASPSASAPAPVPASASAPAPAPAKPSAPACPPPGLPPIPEEVMSDGDSDGGRDLESTPRQRNRRFLRKAPGNSAVAARPPGGLRPLPAPTLASGVIGTAADVLPDNVGEIDAKDFVLSARAPAFAKDFVPNARAPAFAKDFVPNARAPASANGRTGEIRTEPTAAPPVAPAEISGAKTAPLAPLDDLDSYTEIDEGLNI